MKLLTSFILTLFAFSAFSQKDTIIKPPTSGGLLNAAFKNVSMSELRVGLEQRPILGVKINYDSRLFRGASAKYYLVTANVIDSLKKVTDSTILVLRKQVDSLSKQTTSIYVDPNYIAGTGTQSDMLRIKPRVISSVARNALKTWKAGDEIWNTTIRKKQIYNGKAWETVTSR